MLSAFEDDRGVRPVEEEAESARGGEIERGVLEGYEGGDVAGGGFGGAAGCDVEGDCAVGAGVAGYE